MINYLLDTDICIYLIKNRPPEVLEQFRQHSPQEVVISIITLFELEYGVQKSDYQKRSAEALAKFMQPLSVIYMDHPATKEAAAIRAQLEKQGLPIGPYDLLIAGLARSQDLTLVTNNSQAFERIDGLQLENWVS